MISISKSVEVDDAFAELGASILQTLSLKMKLLTEFEISNFSQTETDY